MLTAIIVAAGSSKRLGFDKLMAPIAGKPVIRHTIDAFEQTKSVTGIVIVTRADRVKEFEGLVISLDKLEAVIPGGEHRHNSVAAGLKGLSPGARYVAVHDGARPLITPNQIEQVFEQARIHAAASLAEPVRDTLKRADSDLIVNGSIDRRGVYAMQTPQVFERKLLEQAYQRVVDSGEIVTDEVSAVESLGKRVVLVPNSDVNLKITYESDLHLAEAVLLRRRERGD